MSRMNTKSSEGIPYKEAEQKNRCPMEHLYLYPTKVDGLLPAERAISRHSGRITKYLNASVAFVDSVGKREASSLSPLLSFLINPSLTSVRAFSSGILRYFAG